VRALTPSERRGALVVVLLLGLGAARDLIVARLAPATPPPRPETPSSAVLEPEPGLPERPADAPAPAAPAPPTPALDLNRANAEDLDRLPGIGPVLARRILDQRARAGPFRSVDELRAVRGVGPRLLERLRPRVTVSRAAASGSARGAGPDVQSAREPRPHAADSAQVRARPVR
jgi:competence ComEA-like helix-hairpin-helix protein